MKNKNSHNLGFEGEKIAKKHLLYQFEIIYSPIFAYWIILY